MNLGRYLSKSRIVDLQASDYEGALVELFSVVPANVVPTKDRPALIKEVVEREKAIPTLSNGVCLPHVRVGGMKQKYLFVAGRCAGGLKFNGSEEYGKARLVFLMLSGVGVEGYLNTLSQLTRLYTSSDVSKKILESADFSSFKTAVLGVIGAGSRSWRGLSAEKVEKMNALMAKSATKILKIAKCSAVMILTDSVGSVAGLAPYLKDSKVILVAGKVPQQFPKNPNWSFITVRSFSKSRFSQLGSALMIGLARGLFTPKDKICCIGGVCDGDLIDALAVIDIEREFPNMFISQKEVLPEGVKPEVLERVIDIATELSVEGREGKPVGCIFVIGDTEKLKPHLKQLILNPFYGYKPEDRNVLNPFMDETVKEYSLIDGAFVLDGNGILSAAGALIHTPDFQLQLPGGLGSRHAAAYAISLIVDCVAIVVSSSTGQVTLFRRGQTMPLTEKRKA